GAHRFEVRAADAAGNVSNTAAVVFTLDTTAPALTSFGLDPASDTGTPGDLSTTASLVRMIGVAEAGVAVSLRRGNTTLANSVAASNGSFSFDDVALTVIGPNGFTLVLADAAGNTL